MSFKLHPNLATKTLIIELPLSKVFIEDESHYPWLIVVPKRSDVSTLIDLNQEDQRVLLKELNACQQVLKNLFNPDQLNVAALGNKTPQLHIHIICRYQNDPAWPQAVWDHPVKKKYNKDELIKQVMRIKKALSTSL